MKFSRIDKLNNNLRVFRDDIYPFLGGGNKGRKMDYIAKNIFFKKANALVTTGGIQSNHCRAVAVFATMYKMQCTLVLHGNKQEFLTAGGNAKVMRDTAVKILFVKDSSSIGSAMDDAMDKYTSEGFSPYYIYGGGHTLEGGLAYVDAVSELKDYCNERDWYPDYIFHASGTGSTQSGILAGLDKFSFETEVLGVSVGRKSKQAIQVVGDFYKELCKHYDITFQNKNVTVLDEYLCGGYGECNQEIKKTSTSSLLKYGFTLDTCYTAKAFYGMQDFIKKNKLETKNILFWHTGGVFNYLAE